MAFSSGCHLKSKLLLIVIISVIVTVEAQVDQATGFHLMTEGVERPWAMSAYVEDEMDGGDDDGDQDDGISRRSLYRRLRRYYISYGALSANRISCPPRSGRSYYNHNCYKSRKRVNPYSRGCSRIARCRR